MRILWISTFVLLTHMLKGQELISQFNLNFKSYDSPNIFSDSLLGHHYFLFYNRGQAEWEYHITNFQFREFNVLTRSTGRASKIKQIWQDSLRIYTLYNDSKGILRMLLFNKRTQQFAVNPLRTPLEGEIMGFGTLGQEGIALTYIKKQNAFQVYRYVAGEVRADKRFVLATETEAKRASKADRVFLPNEMDKLEEYAEKRKIIIENEVIYLCIDNYIDDVFSTDLIAFDLRSGTQKTATYLYPTEVDGRLIPEVSKKNRTSSFVFRGKLYQCAIGREFLLLRIRDAKTGKVLFSNLTLSNEPILYKSSAFLKDVDFTGVAYEPSPEYSTTADFLAFFKKNIWENGQYDLFIKVRAWDEQQVELTIGGTYLYQKANPLFGPPGSPTAPDGAMVNHAGTLKTDNINLFFKSCLNESTWQHTTPPAHLGYDALIAFWNKKKSEDKAKWLEWLTLGADDQDNTERKKRVKFFQMGMNAYFMGMHDLKNKQYIIYKSK
jgi:hypothetical protein